MTLVAVFSLCGSAVKTAYAQSTPPGWVFAPPAANACQSKYDQFYEAEPGVYAYWAMCEAGSSLQIYDYAGKWDLTNASGAWPSPPVISGGATGPVSDGETAATITTATSYVESQDIVMNTNGGTIATWINADATTQAVSALRLNAPSPMHSLVSLGVVSSSGSICYQGTFINSANTTSLAQACGYTANTWHRVALSWASGTATLWVDGASAATATYTGGLDNWIFYYQLFPGCCNTGKQMTLAKALVSNVAWGSSRISQDYHPSFPTVPTGGVNVSNVKVGEIYKDVLGYGDYNQDISTTTSINALKTGITAAGFTSVRYANGYAGIAADEENWSTPTADYCDYSYNNPPSVPSTDVPTASITTATADYLDNYMSQIVTPLGLDIGFTVNYGSNPPTCNAGGDPVANGSSLVTYADVTKSYHIANWEIGNEQYDYPYTELNLRNPTPETTIGANYVANEPAFYTDMMAAHPGIYIGVPTAFDDYADETNFSLPVMAGASYNFAITHSYPMKDNAGGNGITDGNTIYQERVASNMSRIRGELSTLQTALLNNGKASNAIWLTEWDASVGGNKWNKQTMGAVMPMFVVTQLAEYMRAGVHWATWFAQGGAGVCNTAWYDHDADTTYNWYACGDNAPVYTNDVGTAGCCVVNVGLQLGDITPAARGFQLLSESGFVTQGEYMVQTTSDLVNAPWLLTYGATHGSNYGVILINRDPSNSHTVPVLLETKSSGSTVSTWTYGLTQYDATKTGNWEVNPVTATTGAWSGTYSATLPPWSVQVIMFGN